MCDIHSCCYESPLGQMLLSARGDFLIGVWFDGQRYCGNPGILFEDDPVLILAKNWLDRYFAGEKPVPAELPLAPEGTAFRRKVWEALKEIPYGETVTYGQISARVGRGSARAVGGAVGHNPISVIIPCHRVIGASGILTGYAGGMERKKFLLELEASK